MNARTLSRNAIPTLAGEITKKSAPDWLVLPGFLMSESGIVLVAFGNWVLLNPMIQTLLIVCGGMLCFFGIVVIPSWLICRMKAASDTLRSGDEAI